MSKLKDQLAAERDKRDLLIVKLRKEGKSLRVIADLVGLSAMRCKQILDRLPVSVKNIRGQ
jgi:DNA-directed RNA polymerase specialized sigma subunit